MDPIARISPYLGTLAFIGTYCLILYNDRLRMPDRIQRSGTTSEGTVVDFRSRPASTAQAEVTAAQAPVVEFVVGNGRHQHVSPHYQQPSPYRIGQKVLVRYHFYKSIRESMLDGESPPTPPRLLLIWGIGMCVLGYPYLFVKLMQLAG